MNIRKKYDKYNEKARNIFTISTQTMSITKLPTYSLCFLMDKRLFYKI